MGKLPKPYTVPFAVPPVLQPSRDATTDYYRSGSSRVVEILPGVETPIWGYNGITPGPHDQGAARPADRRAADQRLPPAAPTLGYTPWTSTHLHGSRVAAAVRRLRERITAGQCKDYRYPNFQDARTLWYHDHGVHHTAENAYMGLAGSTTSRRRPRRRSADPHGALRRPADHRT